MAFSHVLKKNKLNPWVTFNAKKYFTHIQKSEPMNKLGNKILLVPMNHVLKHTQKNQTSYLPLCSFYV